MEIVKTASSRLLGGAEASVRAEWVGAREVQSSNLCLMRANTIDMIANEMTGGAERENLNRQCQQAQQLVGAREEMKTCLEIVNKRMILCVFRIGVAGLSV